MIMMEILVVPTSSIIAVLIPAPVTTIVTTLCVVSCIFVALSIDFILIPYAIYTILADDTETDSRICDGCGTDISCLTVENPCQNNGTCSFHKSLDDYICNCSGTNHTGPNCTGMANY